MQTWFGLIFFELIHYHIAEAGYFSIMWFKDIPNISPLTTFDQFWHLSKDFHEDKTISRWVSLEHL